MEGNILSFSGPGTLSREKRLISGVEAYWEALRPFAGLPSRSQIDPLGLEAALDYTFLLEKCPDGQHRFRLVGHSMHDLLGVDVDRLPFVALFTPALQDRARNAIDAMFSQPAILRGDLSAPRSAGRPALTGRMSVLPLRHDDGTVSRALGVLVPSGRTGRSPRVFESFTHNLTRLVLADATEQTQPDFGMAEPAPNVFQQKGRSEITERPKLRVIQGSKT